VAKLDMVFAAAGDGFKIKHIKTKSCGSYSTAAFFYLKKAARE